MVGRAGRRDQAFRQAQDRRLLYALARKSAQAFATKYGCRAAAELRGDSGRSARSRRSSTRRRTTCIWRPRARRPRPASTSFSTSRSPIRSATAARSPKSAARPASCWRSAISGGAKAISAGSSNRSTPACSARLVNAEANISRDRLGQFDLTSWRYTAAGMPGGVMLQIGVHYADVLEYLIGPIKAVSGRFAQLVLPGDNPDVASMVLEHENGALSTLNASYASASEYYLMNIYGKTATAYYDLHHGLQPAQARREAPVAVPCAEERHLRRGAGGIRRRRARRAAAGSRRRLRDRVRSRSSAPAFLGARGPPRRGGGNPGERLSAATSWTRPSPPAGSDATWRCRP